METVYLSHELSKQNRSTDVNNGNSLTPVESSNFSKQNTTSGTETVSGKREVKKMLPASTAPQSPQADIISGDQSDSQKKQPTKKVISKTFSDFLENNGEDNVIVENIQQYLLDLQGTIEFTQDSLSQKLGHLQFLKTIVCLSTKNSEEKKSQCRWVNEMVNEGITKLFQKLISRTFELPFHEQEFSSVYKSMYGILVVLWNGTDFSQELCDAALNEDIYKDLFRYLDHKVFLPENIEGNQKAFTMVKGFLGILNNLLQKCDVIDAYRQCDGVRIVEKFVRSKNVMVKVKAFMVLSYIINEEENEKINSDDSIFDFLFKILDDTLETDAHHSKRYGYRTEEIVETLNRLAANDSNRELMLKHGIINYYTRLMADDNKSNTHEQALAARGIWIFAFKAKDQILSASGCFDALKSLAGKSENVFASEQAKGAMFVLEGKHQDISAPVDKPKDDKDIQHVMISYQWENQKVMLRVRDQLQKAGYKVWMDVDKMSGLVLEAMANAVENASVVLVCMSQKYKESPNCRTEGDYAFAKRKPIIPLKLQYRYQPDGWLGALVGSTLFFDFSQNGRFQKSLEGLLKELGNRGRIGAPQVVTATMNVPMDMARPENISEVNPQSECTEWNTKKVASWLEQNGLSHLVNSFSEIDGALLDEYKLMHRDAPEFFYKTLESTLKLSLPEMLRFTKVLRTL